MKFNVNLIKSRLHYKKWIIIILISIIIIIIQSYYLWTSDGNAAYLVIVRTVCTFFDTSVLLGFSDLHADHGVHVQACQLPGFNHSDAHLEVLRFQCTLQKVDVGSRLGTERNENISVS